jgi:N-acetylglucosaminyl-diphospho-decaprenol L-rhamnosyltransferase
VNDAVAGPRISTTRGVPKASGPWRQPSLGAVIVTHNSAHVVRECVRSLTAEVDLLTALVVVDNASTDSTCTVTEGAVDKLTLIRNERNVGFGAANNIGARSVGRVEWLLFVNPDVEVISFDADRFALDTRDPGVGIIAFAHVLEGGPKVLYPVRPYGRALTGAFTYSWGLLWPSAFGMPRMRGVGKRTQCWTSASAFAVRAATWHAVEGFDERFFLFYEDVDLSRRIARAGFRSATSASLTVRHSLGTSSSRQIRVQRLAWAVSGWLLYVRKWNGRRPAVACRQALLANLALVECLLRVVSPLSRFSTRFSRKTSEVSALRGVLRRGSRLAGSPDTERPESRALGPRPETYLARALAETDERDRQDE